MNKPIRLQNNMLKIGVILFCIIVITGCGKQNDTPDSTASKETVTENVYNDSWKSKGFQKPKVRDAQQIMNEADYYEVACENIKNSVKSSSIDTIAYDYVLNQRITIISYTDAGKKQYLMEKMTPGEKKPEKIPLFTEDSSVKGNVICLDCVTENDLGCLLEENQQLFLIHLDGQGQVLSKTEVTASYNEQKVTDTLGRTFWWCDEKGNQYVLNRERDVLHIFDASGKFMRARESGQAETYSAAFHAHQGELILVTDNQVVSETRLLWLNTETGATEELTTFSRPFLTHFQMLSDGTIIYSDGSFLWEWNVANGDNKALFNYLGSDILRERFDNVEYVMLTAEDTIHLYSKGTFMDGKLYTLSNAEQETEDGIVLLDMIGEMYVKSCTVEFNKEHPDSFITYKKATGDEETEVAKLMGQLSQGKGPDIICFFPELVSVESLYNMGALADLNKLVDQERMGQIFPGVLATGQVNGEQIGIGIETGFWVYATSENTWREKQWTTDDLLGLIEQNPSLEGILVLSGGEKNAWFNLKFMLGDLVTSQFIDWEKGESHFDDSSFLKVLQYCKMYGNEKVPASEVFEGVKEGKYLATLVITHSEQDFFHALDRPGYDFNFLGRAGQEGWAGYLNSCYLIVVNKNTKHKEEVAEYLKYMLDQEFDSRRINYTPSRRDALEKKYREFLIFMLKDEEKVDFCTEFLINIMEGVAPAEGPDQNELYDIIWSGANEYFEGKKSAEDVARIVDNRVQLYLDERR